MKPIPCQATHPTPFGPLLFFANDCFLAFTLTGRAGRGHRVGNSAHAWGRSPGRAPGTNSPPDCLCPGALLRAGKDSALLLYFAASPTQRPRLHSGVWQPLKKKPRSTGSGRWGVLRSEVKEEGRVFSGPEERARTQTVHRTVCAWRAPGALSPGMSAAACPSGPIPHQCPQSSRSRMAASGRKRSTRNRRVFHASRVAPSAVEYLT
jgi:hypothetical protein